MICLLPASAVSHYVQLPVRGKFLVLQNVWSSVTQCDKRCTCSMSACVCLCVCVGVHLLVARKVYAMTVRYVSSCDLKLIIFTSMYQYSIV